MMMFCKIKHLYLVAIYVMLVLEILEFKLASITLSTKYKEVSPVWYLI